MATTIIHREPREPKAPPTTTITQIAVSTEASGNHTTVIALLSDDTIWRIVHIGNIDTGQWSHWEQLPSVPTINSQEK